jgi:hypothetical protein
VAETTPVTVHRNERVLAFMIGSCIGLSLIAIVAIIIASATGMEGSDFSHGIWPTLAILPEIGLPLGFILIIALLVISSLRRSRAAKDATH